MKTLTICGANQFCFGQAPTPLPGPSEIAIDVLASGICGTDLEILQGEMVYFTSGAASYPIIPGHEWTGVVRATGRDVSGYSPGDRVVGEVSIGCMTCKICLTGNYHRCPARSETGVLNRPGSFAEQLSLPAMFVHKISTNVSIQSAALVEPTAIAFNGVRRARISPSDQVAVFGDGPIGLLALQISRIFGAHRAVLVGAADRRLALARTLGADAIVDARSEDVAARLRREFGGSLPSVVIDASGNPDAIRTAIAVTAPGGRLILQGFCGAQRIHEFTVDPVIVNDLTVIGALGSPGIWPDVIRLIESGRINPSALVTDELPIASFAEGIRRLRLREAVKVVLRSDTEDAWK